MSNPFDFLDPQPQQAEASTNPFDFLDSQKVPTNVPLPPPRPSAEEIAAMELANAPLPPPRPRDIIEQLGLMPNDTLELPKGHKLKDDGGLIGDRSALTLEEQADEVNGRIASADKAIAEATERFEAAKARHDRVIDGMSGRAIRPGSQSAVHLGIVKEEMEREKRALDDATSSKLAILQAAPPTLKASADFGRRGLQAAGEMLPDVAAGAMRPVDALLGTDLASGPKAVSDAIGKAFVEDPARAHEFTAQLGQGVGSAVGFIMGGGAARAAGMSAGKASTLLGGFQGAEERYEEAEKLGQKGWDLAKNYVAGFGIGGTEGVLGIGKLADLDRITSGGVKRFFGLVLKEKGEEGLQEATQTLLTNLADRGLLGKDVPIEEGVGRSALIGAMIGGGMAAVSGGVEAAANKALGIQPPAPVDPAQASVLQQLLMEPPASHQSTFTPGAPQSVIPQTHVAAGGPGAGRGGNGPLPAPTGPQAAPAAPAAPGAPAPAPVPGDVAPAGPAGDGSGRVGDPASSNPGPDDLGPVPTGGLGTEALDEDTRLLLGDGWDLESIGDMSAAERAQAIAEARERGVTPVTPAVTPVTGAASPASGPVSHETAASGDAQATEPQTTTGAGPSSSTGPTVGEGAPSTKPLPTSLQEDEGGTPQAGESSQRPIPADWTPLGPNANGDMVYERPNGQRVVRRADGTDFFHRPLKNAPGITQAPGGEFEPVSAENPQKTPGKGAETAPSAVDNPVPGSLAELRERLPKDADGNPDFEALNGAVAATKGERTPWGKLSPEEKQAAWDHLNGQTRDEGAGQEDSVPAGIKEAGQGLMDVFGDVVDDPNAFDGFLKLMGEARARGDETGYKRVRRNLKDSLRAHNAMRERRGLPPVSLESLEAKVGQKAGDNLSNNAASIPTGTAPAPQGSHESAGPGNVETSKPTEEVSSPEQDSGLDPAIVDQLHAIADRYEAVNGATKADAVRAMAKHPGKDLRDNPQAELDRLERDLSAREKRKAMEDAGEVEDPLASPSSSGSTNREQLIDALERIERGENIEDGAIRKALIEQKWAKGGTKLKVAAAGQRELDAEREQRKKKAILLAKLDQLPNDIDELIERAKALIEPYNAAVVSKNTKERKRLGEQIDLLEIKANSLREDGWAAESPRFGILSDESPRTAIQAALTTKPGVIPRWGENGVFNLTVDGVPVIVSHGDIGGPAIHAPDLGTKFPSPTGYHSMLGYSGWRSRGEEDNGIGGMTVEQYWQEAVRHLLNGNGLKGTMGVPPAKLELPASAYRFRTEEERKGQRLINMDVIAHQGAMRAYYLLENTLPDQGAPDPVYNKADFRADLTEGRHYDGRRNVSTAVGPNGAEYFIRGGTERDGEDETFVSKLYKREGKTFTVIATEEGEWHNRFDLNAPLVEKAIEDAFADFDELPSERGKAEEKPKKGKTGKSAKPEATPAPGVDANTQVVPVEDDRQREKKQKAREAGAQAARDGGPRTPPNYLGGELRDEWLAGYASAQAETKPQDDLAAQKREFRKALNDGQPATAPDGSVYRVEEKTVGGRPSWVFKRTSDGVTLTKGGAGVGLWSRGKAVQAAFEDAFPEEANPDKLPSVNEGFNADADWWNRDLTGYGRKQAAEAAGVHIPNDKTYWHNLPPETQRKLRAVKGTDKDPAHKYGSAAEEKPAAEAPAAPSLDDITPGDTIRVTFKEPVEEKGRTFPSVEGRYIQATEKHRFVETKERQPGAPGGWVVTLDPDNIASLEVVESNAERLKKLHDKARGERIPTDFPRTRAGYEKWLRDTARLIADTEDRKRKDELTEQFNDVANEIELAEKKRSWLLAEARYRKHGGDKKYPARDDFSDSPADAVMKFSRPKASDFDPDKAERAKRAPEDPDPRSPKQLIKRLESEGFEARFSVSNPDGDPDNAHVLIIMPGGKEKGRFIATGSRADGEWSWKLSPYEANSSKAAQDRIRKAQQSPDYDRLKVIVAGSGKPTSERVDELRGQMVVFASGLSRVKDLEAGGRATGGLDSRGIGVEINELSNAGMKSLAKAIVVHQAQTFVDSGAFGLFRKNLRNAEKAKEEALATYPAGVAHPSQWAVLDFDQILKRYENLLEQIGEQYEEEGEPSYPKPLLVMPDVVGDQAASLELVEKYAKVIKTEAEWNVSRPIVPIQKGELTMAQAYDQVVSILGTDNFIVGIPSNEKALTNDELRDFITEAKPKRLHFLGAAAKSRLDKKLRVLAETGLDFEHLSADGNILRGALYGIEQPEGTTRGQQVSQTIADKSPELYEFDGGLAGHFADKLANYGPIKNIAEARKIAGEYGVTDPKVIEETIEKAIVMAARQIVASKVRTDEQKFDRLHQLYVRQPNLATRTSTSMLNQAYSTPIPLAFVASRLAGASQGWVLEPTAGNGALLIEVDPKQQSTTINEINDARAANLKALGFEPTQEDASDPDLFKPNTVDVVIANPPFGVVKDEIGESEVYDLTDIQKKYRTKEIDHAISLRALAAMKDNGRAVLIIGSVNPQKDRSQGYRAKAKNEFFLTLLRNYNVTDIFTVDGDLYKKQGAGWPVDVIVIEGRGKSNLTHPAAKVPPVLSSWDEVKAKLNGVQGTEDGSRSEAADAPVRGGRGGPARDDGGNRLPDGGGGDTGIQPRPDQSQDVRPDGDRGQPGPQSDPAPRGQRGGSRDGGRADPVPDSERPSSVTAEEAVNAAIEELFAEAPAPAPSNPDIERFRTSLTRTDEAWAPDPLDGARDVKHEIRAIGGRLQAVSHYRGAIMGSSAFLTRAEAIDELVRRAYGGGDANAREVNNAVRMTRLRMEEALDSATGRNGAAKNPESAKRDIEVALKYLNEDVEKHGQAALDAVAENIKSLKKAAKATGVEIKLPKAPKPKPAPAKEVAAGIREAGEGLMQLFGPGDGTKLNSGFTFDDETYERAKPHFLKAIAHLKNAAADIMATARELVAFMRDQLGATGEVIRKMQPYLVRFIEQVQDGSIFRQNSLAPSATQPQGELEETENQVTYRPRSQIAGLGTLIPTNMRSATEAALEELEKRVGNLETFVAKELDYQTDAEGPFFIRNGQKERPFAAEQVDALALAIDNMNKGAALIIGDQTGIGKGRVNGGIIRYAIVNKAIPIFVTRDPRLYKDIYRDVTDIGLQEYIGREPRILMTDANKSIPLDDEGRITLKTKDTGKHNALLMELAQKGSIAPYDFVVTSYSQMQSVKGQSTDRMRFFDAIADKAIMAMDESHNAGGQAEKRDDYEAKLKKWEKAAAKARRNGTKVPPMPEKDVPDRAQFARNLIDKVRAAFYSSATYAKRPDVMDLYRKTDMRLAVKDISELAAAIQAGGVPMQQVVASMLAKAGQYVRRERSFSGVSYDPQVVPVDENVYDDFSTALALIQDFAKIVARVTAGIDSGLKGEGGKTGHDNATGEAGASSTNFTSIMHNLINQMLLAINAQPAAEQAIAALKRGEKPLIAVAGTNEAFLSNYAADMGLKVGDSVEVDMSQMLNRYLERSRWITIREAFMEAGEEAEKRRLTDEDLGEEGVAAFEAALDHIKRTDFSALPASPIDYIRAKIKQAGFRPGEITGRGLTIEYSEIETAPGQFVQRQKLVNRNAEERTTRGTNATINRFNSGELDVLILNQSGSTGVSMHASSKFKDQSKRLMIIAQPEANIDTHMQMLGRVHRTGQVRLPAYIQLIPDVPAAKRPAAILLKKMASLNANTTASRKSALTSDTVVDFMNEYGDAVAINILRDDDELSERLDLEPPSDKGNPEGYMRKMTGRIPLLRIEWQRELYERIEEEYTFLLQQMEAEGKNVLEAKTLELDAKPVRSIESTPAEGPSPFQQAVTLTEYNIKRLGKPYSLEELGNDLAKGLGVDRSVLPQDLTQAIERAAEIGRQQVEAETEEALRKYQAFKQKQLDRITDEKKIEANRTRLNAVETNHQALTGFLYPGNRVRLKYSDDESITGIVLKVTPAPEKATNPIAPGQWKVKIAVPAGERSREYPFGRFVVGKDPEGNEVGIEHAGWAEPTHATVKLFELAATIEPRETRVIATGNLLKAFTSVARGGTILNFQTHDGHTIPGIMLRARVATLDDALQNARIPMSAAELTDVLKDPQMAGIPFATDDGYLTLTASGFGRRVTLAANRARDKGGKYTLNRGVLAVTGDFYSRGGRMVAEVSGDRIGEAINALVDAGAKFTKGMLATPDAITVHGDDNKSFTQAKRRVEGLFSATEKAVANAKTQRASGQQWLNTLKNAPGVKAEELAWIGLDERLGGENARHQVSKDELLEHIAANRVQLDEVVSREPTEQEIQEKAREIAEQELEEGFNTWLDSFGDDRLSSYWSEAIPEEDESDYEESDDYDEDEDEETEREPTGRWKYVIHGDGSSETSWRTYDTESDAAVAGSEEADRLNQAELDSLKNDYANENQQSWETYESEARLWFDEDGPSVKYSSYKTEGANDSYREWRLTLPSMKRGSYGSPHWDERNIVVHFRTTERTVDGKRTLFIEEIQSDWHQAGRKKGYRPTHVTPDSLTLDKTTAVSEPDGTLKYWFRHPVLQHPSMALMFSYGDTVAFAQSEEQARKTAADSINRAIDTATDGVPNAPFKTTWHELALKRIIQHAVDDNVDQIAWTTGDQQNERFGLEKHFSALDLTQTKNGNFILQGYDHNGKTTLSESIQEESDLPNWIGEDLAKRLLAAPVTGRELPTRTLRGDDLRMGGEGMRGFYDKILVDAATKLGKKFGAKAARFGGHLTPDGGPWRRINASGTSVMGSYPTQEEAQRFSLRGETVRYEPGDLVHTLSITPEMKLAVTVDGLPMFMAVPQEKIAHYNPATQAAVKEIEEIVRRIAGPGVGIKIRSQLYGQGENMRASGATTTFRAEVGGWYARGQNEVAVSLNPRWNYRHTAYHEAFHDLQYMGMLSDAEKAILDRERARTRAWIAQKYAITPEALAQMPDHEVDAHAFDIYADERDRLGPVTAGKGLHIAIRRVLAKLYEAWQLIKAVLQRRGLTVEDVFERAYRGDVAIRPVSRETGKGEGVVYSQAKRTFSEATIAEVEAANRRAGLTPAPRTGPAPSFQTPERTRIDRVRESHQDTFRFLDKLQGSIEAARGAPLPDGQNAYQAQTLYHGKASERLEDFKRDMVEPLVKAIKDAGVTTDEVGVYLIAKHAHERNQLMAERDPSRFAQDGGSGLADKAADEFITRFIAEGKEPALERIAQMIYGIIAFDTDNRWSSGLISDETRDHWQNLFPSGRYVPLRGKAERDEDAPIGHFGRGFDIRGREAKVALGRESLSDNPLDSVIHMAEEGIVRSEKNRVGKTLLRLVRNNPNSEVWHIVRAPKMQVLRPDQNGIQRAVDVPDPRYLMQDNVFAVKVGGTPYFIELAHPSLAKAFKRLGDTGMGAVASFFAPATRLYASLQTGRNPEFFIRNFLRDIQEAITYTTSVKPAFASKVVKHLFPAWKAAMAKAYGRSAGQGWDAIYDEWRHNGGRISNFSFRDIDAIHRDIAGELKQLSEGKIKGLSRKGLRGLVKLVDGLNEGFESATRLAVYKAAREQGLTKEQSATHARQATINFTKRGFLSPSMNVAYVFYNASVQGSVKNLEMLARSKRMRIAWGSLVILGFAMNMLGRMLGDDDEEGRRPFDEVPDFQRRKNIIIPLYVRKDAQGNQRLRYLQIPLMFGFTIPYYLGDQIASVVSGTVKPGKAVVNTLTNVLDAFNPIGEGNPITMVAPTLTRPLVELYMNKDWRDRPIYPEQEKWNEGLPKSSQPTNATTHPYMTAATEKVNDWTGGSKYEPGYVDVYPGAVQYSLEWITGGAGRFIMNSGRTILDLAAGEGTPFEKVPILRQALGETNGQGEAQRYYELREEKNERENRFRNAKKAVAANPDDEDARATLEKESEWLGVSPDYREKTKRKGSAAEAFTKADEDIRSLRDAKRAIQNDSSLSRLEQIRRSQEIDSEIQTLQRNARGLFKSKTRAQ